MNYMSRRNFLARTNPDGSRELSLRLWLLVWVAPVLFLVAAAYEGVIAWDRVHNSVPVMGVVDKVYSWPGTSPFDRGVTNYSPRFRYTDEAGREVSATSGNSHPDWNFPLGTQMEIRHFPGRNADIVIPGPHNWFVVRVVGLIGLALIVPAALASLLLIRWKRRGQAREGGEAA